MNTAGRGMLSAFVSLVPLLVLLSCGYDQQRYGLLIKGGKLLDGTGNPWYYADVAVTGDRIVAVGDLDENRAQRVVDATGLYVAPGFIDVHTHAGGRLATAELSHAQPLLAQGTTTALLNPDGGGPTDLAQQKADLLEHGLGINVGLLVSHGSVRREVLGMADRAPTSDELERMKDLARTGMEEGAFGLSSGLYYAPGSYANTEEVIELAKVVAEYGGVYTSHIRDEADYNIGVVAAVEELIRIAREGRLRGVVTHIKALGPRVWGYSQTLVQRIEQARTEGVEVFADQYPYTASGTSIGGALIPRWAQVGGRDSLLHRIDTPSERARLRADILENLDRRGGAATLQFRYHEADTTIEGRTLQAVADERGMEPADLAIELTKAGGAGLVSFNMTDADVETLMRQRWTMTSSDGGLVPMGRGIPHPRYYGTFPRKIRRYVIEKGVLDLPSAVRSMTTLPATVFRLTDRGVVRPGAVADLVVFDLEQLTDKATYDDPHHLCEGMVYVLVNGELAIDGEEFTGAMVGRVLAQRG
ncbi:MAG: amidohydrolase family protein [Gemmatimonadales bacterium]|nr:amidohydrolase family protein [Gemmatimonadales bacterium]NIN10800.1 amidohydrolase family protein [Gemmatimonadales bacterium]NIN49444.1 amidohydrolase family protein [Gemmatimonadales bacterium]NIP06908.1 amidohydrolase family protein [Gemmatimonadales bacterium]NIR02844.1 amidohydrolase family protein [Gemmatimonadales bacterium]